MKAAAAMAAAAMATRLRVMAIAFSQRPLSASSALSSLCRRSDNVCYPSSYSVISGFRFVSVSCAALTCVRRVSEFFREIATFISRLGIVLLYYGQTVAIPFFMPFNSFFAVFQALSL